MDSLEVLAICLCLAAAAGYGVAGILCLRKNESVARNVAILAWISNLSIVVKNLLLNGYAPLANMYQVMSVLSLCFLPIYLMVTAAEPAKKWLAPFFYFTAAIPLVGTLFMEKTLKWALMPALRSPWFVPHVLSYMLSYSLATVAFVLTVSLLFSRGDRKERQDAIYTVLRISFVFMTSGLCLGAIWADEVWGNFWQWDVKEIWSLITALCYLGYFHCRRLKNGQRVALVFSVAGFASLIVTFLCINLLPSVIDSFHIYT